MAFPPLGRPGPEEEEVRLAHQSQHEDLGRGYEPSHRQHPTHREAGRRNAGLPAVLRQPVLRQPMLRQPMLRQPVLRQRPPPKVRAETVVQSAW